MPSSSCSPRTRLSRSGFCAPKNTPAEIIDKLNKEINAALADPKVKARLAD
jgi:tripartite-type tricarboxylate transporter receptor subunit TctC